MKKIKSISLVFVTILLALIIVSTIIPKIYAEDNKIYYGSFKKAKDAKNDGYYIKESDAKKYLFDKLYKPYIEVGYIPVDLDTLKVNDNLLKIDAIFLPPYETIKNEEDRQKFIKKTDIILHRDKGVKNINDVSKMYAWKDKYELGKSKSKYYLTTTEDLIIYKDTEHLKLVGSDASYKIKYTFKDKKDNQWKIKSGFNKHEATLYTSPPFPFSKKLIKYTYDKYSEPYFKH